MKTHQEKKKRIIIIGGGFAGLKLIKILSKSSYEVTLIDKNNFHQFQPLFYQVATSGIEPSSIIFPFRKIIQKKKNIIFRMTEVERIIPQSKKIVTSLGSFSYDYLIIATGATNNFFGNKNIENFAIPMKSINESLRLRNIILESFEKALSATEKERESLLTFAIAGAGPTGVELAGTLAEMKKYVLPKDYPELDFHSMKIILVEGSSKVLGTMSEYSSKKAYGYLKKLGVEIRLNTFVSDYDGTTITFKEGEPLQTKTLIWSAGIKGSIIEGLPESSIIGTRIKVNEYNNVEGVNDIFAVGDVAAVTNNSKYPKGHPQLAQVAIQQGENVAKNLIHIQKGKKLHPFTYKNLGTMATVGRNKAVVEIKPKYFSGFFAWLIWLVVHLRSILGVKNKWIVFINWVWNYFTYNLSLRLIIKRKDED